MFPTRHRYPHSRDEDEVTLLTPEEAEDPLGGYGKTISHVVIGLKTSKGTK